MKTFLKVWLSISLIAIGIGIGLIILAFASGATWEDYPTFSVNGTYDGVENIDFDIAYGDVDIIEGDSFHIDAENYLENDLESYVTDGTWYIRESSDNDFSLFGMRFTLRQLVRWNNDYTPRMTITVPKGFIANNFNLSIGAGNVEVEAVNAATGNFSVDAGRMAIDQISVSDNSDYHVGAGNMVLKEALLHDIIVDCGVGNISINGDLTGDSEVDCGVGKVELMIEGDSSEYSYDINADIGSVNVGGKSYHNLDKSIDNDAANSLELQCGIGNITVDFN